MKDNLKKVKKMDLENMLGQTAIHILVIGNKINMMDQENFFPSTDIMKESLIKILEMETDLSFIVMDIYIEVSGIRI